MSSSSTGKLYSDVNKIGSNTAATLLILWLEGHLTLTRTELRVCIKKLAELMEEVEEARSEGQEPLFRNRWTGPSDPQDE